MEVSVRAKRMRMRPTPWEDRLLHPSNGGSVGARAVAVPAQRPVAREVPAAGISHPQGDPQATVNVQRVLAKEGFRLDL